MQHAGDIVQHAAEVRRVRGDLRAFGQQAFAIAGSQRIEHTQHLSARHAAKHGAHIVCMQRTATVGNRLVEQRQAVTQGAVRRPRQLADRAVFVGNVLGTENVPHLAGYLFRQQPLQVELQAARQHRHGQLLRVGGGQQELYVRRRLFQRLQQRIECVLRQHVHLIDQVHLEAAARRCVLRVLDHFAHVVHAGVAGRIDFQQVDKAAFIHRRAHRALAARVSRLPTLAIQRLGEDARDRGLADAAGAGEQVGMMHAPGIERIGERAHDMLLPDQLGELAWAPLAGEYLIGHD